MAISEQDRQKVLASCGRRCCICNEFVGLKIELHHIKKKSSGGTDDFDNLIPLCFSCHADMGDQVMHHKGNKYSEEELKMHRDRWYREVSAEIISAEKELSKVELTKESVDNNYIDRSKDPVFPIIFLDKIVGSGFFFFSSDNTITVHAEFEVQQHNRLQYIAAFPEGFRPPTDHHALAIDFYSHMSKSIVISTEGYLIDAMKSSLVNHRQLFILDTTFHVN